LCGAEHSNTIAPVTFKQKIPALGAALFIGGGIVAYLALRPPPEDRFQQAVLAWAASQGGVQDVQIHGTVADVAFEPDGRVVHAEFALRGQDWTFVKDLYQDFLAAARSPATERSVLDRLGGRLAERYQSPISFKQGLQTDLAMVRDASGLAGLFGVRFALPVVNGKQKLGRYVERFRYENGTWESEGLGSLVESLPR
jgi:hypothetical protein